MGRLMSIVKRNVNVEVIKNTKDNYEIVLDGATYKTYVVCLRGIPSWSVPAEACKKHFGIAKESFIEHHSAKAIHEANEKNRKSNYAFRENQRKEFYGEVE